MASTKTQPDLPKIIKRLELIKNLISLEEEDEIALQVTKLKQFSLIEELQNVVNLLEQKSYSEAMIFLGAFINKHHQLSFYLDPEIDALKLEAKSLENQINILSDQKADLEKLVHEFGYPLGKNLVEIILKNFDPDNPKNSIELFKGLGFSDEEIADFRTELKFSVSPQ